MKDQKNSVFLLINHTSMVLINQYSAIEFSVMEICAVSLSVLSNAVATSHTWLLSPRNVASAVKELSL